MSAKFGTTIGFERRHNPALLPRTRDEFIRFMTTDLPPRPANMLHIVAVNQGRQPYTLGEPSVPPRSVAEVEALQAEGVVVIDARPTQAFAAGHVAGALNVPGHSALFEQYIGWLLGADARFVLVAAADGDAPALARALAVVGLDSRVAGYLQGGMEAWRAAGKPVGTLSLISVADLFALHSRQPLAILDVRDASEWDEGHIAGALHKSYRELPHALPQLPLDPLAPLAVVCEGGVRSSVAASYLRRHGFRQVMNVVEGMNGWRRAGHPVEN